LVYLVQKLKKMKNSSDLKIRIEQISFESNGEYMDIITHTDYVDITIGGTENSKFSVTLEDWKIINKKVVELLKQH
jgi:hypothetical protein